MFKQLNLICASGDLIGWIGSAYFAGWTSSCLIVPLVSDRIGRKWIVLVSVAFQIVFHTVMVFS